MVTEMDCECGRKDLELSGDSYGCPDCGAVYKPRYSGASEVPRRYVRPYDDIVKKLKEYPPVGFHNPHNESFVSIENGIKQGWREALEWVLGEKKGR